MDKDWYKREILSINTIHIAKIILVSIVILLAFSSCVKDKVLTPPTNKIKHSFVVAGHVYGSPIENTIGIYPPFKEKFPSILETPNLYHAIYTGDVVRHPYDENEWDIVIEDMDSFVDDYHIAAGNHDRGDVFLDRFGSYYYSFKEGSDLFIILNTNHWNIVGEQKEFLENTLADIENTSNIFVFCHELIWWSPDSIFQNIGINFLPHYPGSSNYWSEISPLLEGCNKAVYLFSGDLGATTSSSPYAYYNYANIHLVASGMGRANTSNYLIVNVFEDHSVKINLKAIEGDPDKFGDITLYELP